MTILCTHTHHENRPTEGTVYGWFQPLGPDTASDKQRCVMAEADPGRVTAWPPGLQGSNRNPNPGVVRIAGASIE